MDEEKQKPQENTRPNESKNLQIGVKRKKLPSEFQIDWYKLSSSSSSPFIFKTSICSTPSYRYRRLPHASMNIAHSGCKPSNFMSSFKHPPYILSLHALAHRSHIHHYHIFTSKHPIIHTFMLQMSNPPQSATSPANLTTVIHYTLAVHKQISTNFIAFKTHLRRASFQTL